MILITCTGDNYPLTKIAVEFGYKIGAQLPCTVYAPLYFGDQNWKKPNRKAYMDALSMYKPTMATVLDIEREDQYNEVLNWAEEASTFVEYLVLIPKAPNVISRLPRKINGKSIILGYSVPTKYAGTTLPPTDFEGWPIHLLGGDPFRQLWLCRKLDVFSLDGNYHQKMANRFCQYFSYCPIYTACNPNWPTLTEGDGKAWVGNGRFEAYRRSCESIKEFWRLHDL